VQVLAIERRPARKRPTSKVLDWVAFVFAFLAPPVGFVLGVVSVLVGLCGRGWTTALGRAGVAIGLSLTVVLAVGE
jgi:hypothetical protein